MKDVPDEYGIPKSDVGVDLVARERITGDLVAIQCKYYDPTTTIQKGHIDSFLNELGKKYYASGIIVASSPLWSNNAENALKDRDKKIARIGFEDLINSHIDWSEYSPSKAQAFAPLKPAKKPRPHQEEAIDAVLEGFKEQDRGKLIMAPGTGKTYTSLQIAERLAKEKAEQFRVLYLVPSIQLLSQSLRGWTGDSIYANDMNTIAVCSDRNACLFTTRFRGILY
ncbi:DEAD/DEAH box helicase family protein [Ruoffia sp. FAM 26254]|uniref:restriction endonuclease n=1 Tax=Ruoffia sp. FAM 26254 TaxID=3259518 RepID=UPI00388693DE